MTPPAAISLKARALRLLARREHSRQELARKLTAHAESRQDLEQVLDELSARGWLSTERFIESLVNRKAARFGTERIRQELRSQGLGGETSAAALAALRASEAERAQALWQRRFQQPATSPQERARQARFLAGRGFSAEVIRRIVNASVPEDADPGLMNPD